MGSFLGCVPTLTPLEQVTCLAPEQGVFVRQAESVTSGHINIRDSFQREEKSHSGQRDEGRRGAAGLAGHRPRQLGAASWQPGPYWVLAPLPWSLTLPEPISSTAGRLGPLEQVVPRPRRPPGGTGRCHQKSIARVETGCKRAVAKDNGGEFRLEVFRLSNEVLGTENLGGRRGEVPVGFPPPGPL